MPLSPNTFKEFVSELKQKIRQSQTNVLQGVNKELITLYWSIGHSIVQKEFIATRGFSVQNLWNMRMYYLAYKEHPKLQTLSREISWSHNLELKRTAPLFSG